MDNKKFLKIDELINVIKNKGITISNDQKTKLILKDNNYYVVMGYKTVFKKNGNYKSNVNFEDIYKIYQFDNKLKHILLEAMLNAESLMKTHITNYFSNKYGYTEKDYLDKNNYNYNHYHIDETLTDMKNQIYNNMESNKALNHYSVKYKFIPLWVANKVFTFGLIKNTYLCMKDIDKLNIMKEITDDSKIATKDFGTFLRIMVAFRNRAAHNAIVYNEFANNIWVSRNREHNRFDTKFGRNDLLAVLIALKYILNKDTFNEVLDEISILIDKTLKDINSITKDDLLKEMHLPNNYEILKW